MRYTIRWRIFGWQCQWSNLEKPEPTQVMDSPYSTVVVKNWGRLNLQKMHQTEEQKAALDKMLDGED